MSLHYSVSKTHSWLGCTKQKKKKRVSGTAYSTGESRREIIERSRRPQARTSVQFCTSFNRYFTRSASRCFSTSSAKQQNSMQEQPRRRHKHHAEPASRAAPNPPREPDPTTPRTSSRSHTSDSTGRPWHNRRPPPRAPRGDERRQGAKGCLTTHRTKLAPRIERRHTARRRAAHAASAAAILNSGRHRRREIRGCRPEAHPRRERRDLQGSHAAPARSGPPPPTAAQASPGSVA